MKRISFLCAVTAAAALAVAGISAGAASATVLCKTAPLTHECGASSYGLGTEIEANLAEGSEAVFSTKAGSVMARCSKSTIKMSVAELSKFSGPVWSQVSQFSFGSCNVPVEPTGLGTLATGWLEGTHDGIVWGEPVRVNANTGLFGNCNLLLALNGGSSETDRLLGGAPARLSFKNARVYRSEGLCPELSYFNAQYNVTAPSPLYVESK